MVHRHAKMWGFGARGKLVGGVGDVVYGSGMPLYHSAGGGIGVSMMMHSGATLLVRRGFSASAWLGDVRRHGVTHFQYIGELCRYILAQARETSHVTATPRHFTAISWPRHGAAHCYAIATSLLTRET